MNDWKGIGNLTGDPDLSYTPNTQTAKCIFTVAINRPRRNGEDQGADYIRIVTWGKTAESCDRYLSKGRKVAISGPIRTGSYKNRDGKTVYTTDVWAEKVEFLTPAEQPRQQVQPAPAPAPDPELDSQQMGFNDLPDTFAAAEDDIPF